MAQDLPFGLYCMVALSIYAHDATVLPAEHFLLFRPKLRIHGLKLCFYS